MDDFMEAVEEVAEHLAEGDASAAAADVIEDLTGIDLDD